MPKQCILTGAGNCAHAACPGRPRRQERSVCWIRGASSWLCYNSNGSTSAILIVALSCVAAWFGCTLCILVSLCHTSRMTLQGSQTVVARDLPVEIVPQGVAEAAARIGGWCNIGSTRLIP